MTHIKNKLNLGFTLVELLIVIALLGVLAAAVLAAINPLEQANRSRDAKYKSDSSQLLAAIDRYFVSMDEFPWMTVDEDLTSDEELVFVSAESESIGVCGATCLLDGVLITNNELKTEFRNRDFAKSSPTWDEMIYVGKEEGASASVYTCYVPKSKSERAKATTTIAVGSSERTEVTAAECTAKTYASLATSCVTCLPQ